MVSSLTPGTSALSIGVRSLGQQNKDFARPFKGLPRRFHDVQNNNETRENIRPRVFWHSVARVLPFSRQQLFRITCTGE
jgi:hypothetical protein